MARKVSREETGAEDLDVLHPERELTLAGEPVTVREYGFVQGMRLRPHYEPFLAALREQARGEQAAGLEAVIAEHLEAVTLLMAESVGKPAAWVEALSAREGEALMDAWWAVNGPFFLRCLTRALARERAAARAEAGAGPMSTSASQAPGTTRPGSATTPGASSCSTTTPPNAPKTGNEAS